MTTRDQLLVQLIDEAAKTIRRDRLETAVKHFLVGWLSGVLFITLVNLLFHV
ncbi:hypothetical protein LCGC14_2997990 [marine sediment metagenome]|uniref:Uncharacterized protein n=1 Tax=marine sediment metagenome TaxID=412755 RepID=A0A0F8Z9F2_9ZZZZ